MKDIQKAFDILIGVTESRLDELCKENFDLTNEIQEMNTIIGDLEEELNIYKDELKLANEEAEQLKLQLSEALN
jgi:peptidoglycan hydrolase CwlO-like protein